jgi:hypothetical protein
MQQNQTNNFIRICQNTPILLHSQSGTSEGPIYTQRQKKLKEEVHHLQLRKLCGHDHPIYPK